MFGGKGSDSKYVWLCGPHGICPTYCCHAKAAIDDVNKWVWLCSNKTAFPETGEQLVLKGDQKDAKIVYHQMALQITVIPSKEGNNFEQRRVEQKQVKLPAIVTYLLNHK